MIDFLAFVLWEYIRQTCVAGQQKIRREQATADDDFGDLLV
jgi:hypothetical protein